MLARPKVVQSPGWDPGHHEELRNGPEVKIYIWKVVFGVSKKVWFFPVLYRKVLECSGGFHGGAHLSRMSHMDQGVAHQPYMGQAPTPTWSMHMG